MWKKIALGWEIFKGALRKLKSAFGGNKAKITSRELEIPVPGGRSIKYYGRIIESPITKETMTFVDGGGDSILTFPATMEAMSKVLDQAGAKELEDPLVRTQKIKRSEDAQSLLEAPQVKALPDEEKLSFSAFAFIAYGDESFHSQAFPEAEKAYRQAYEFAQKLDDKPLQAICLNLIGAALGMQAQTEKALPCFDEAIKLKPDYAGAWNNKGVALGNLGQHKEALACFDEAIKLKPDCTEAWVNKGAALYKLGQTKEALACYGEVVKLKPDDAEAWNNKGAAHGKLGQYGEALPCFDKAIKLKSDYAEAWSNKGAALYKLGQTQEALACFDEAVKLKPDYAEAWYNKGEALQKLGLESIRSGDMKEAEERALELVELRKEAERDDMAQVVDKAVMEFKEGLSKKELKSFDEFEEILRRFEGKKP